MDDAAVRCTTCRTEFAYAQLQGATACPSCGSTGKPMAISQDTTVRINWHELRILTIWSDNWAQAKCDAGNRATLASIIRELEKQRPDDDAAALTMAGEVRALQREHPESELRDGAGNVVVPSRGKPS